MKSVPDTPFLLAKYQQNSVAVNQIARPNQVFNFRRYLTFTLLNYDKLVKSGSIEKYYTYVSELQ